MMIPCTLSFNFLVNTTISLINLNPLNSTQAAEISTCKARLHKLKLPGKKVKTCLLLSMGILYQSDPGVDKAKLFQPNGIYFYTLLEFFEK